MRRIAWSLALSLALCTSAGLAPIAAQGTWDATLFVDPNPSPYLSDWENNQSLGTLTVVNGTAQAQSVRLVFSVVNGQGRVLVSGSSEPQLVPADAPAIFHSPINIAGRTRHDTEVEAQMRRTGRLPEGTYRLCITVIDLSGFELAEACEGFTLTYPEPPMLVTPAHQEVVENSDLIFQWTPSHVPIGVDVRYVLQVAKVGPGMLPAEALSSGSLQYVNEGVVGSHLQYPMGAPQLVSGERYAWRVQALDVNGFPVAANNGSSEIWTFSYSDGSEANPTTALGEGAPAQLRLVLASDEQQTDGGVTVRPSIGALCASAEDWAQGKADSTLTLRIAGPTAPTESMYVGVQYAADTLMGLITSRRWMIHGRKEDTGFEVFATGDCDAAPTALGAANLHYVAIKRAKGSFDQFIADMLTPAPEPGTDGQEAAPPAYTPQEGFSLEFGAAIISLRTREVGSKKQFEMEKDFFEGHEFEVKPGLNVFGVVRLDETGDHWARMRELGWNERKFDIYGFAGMSAVASVGAGYATGEGGGAEANVSLQREFFKLRIDLPEKTGNLKFFKSIRGGIEFAVHDSLATGVGATESVRSKHIIGRALLELDAGNDNVIEIAGGFDRSVDQEYGEIEKDPKWELVLSGGCDCQLHFPVGSDSAWIGNPAIEFHVGWEPILILTGEFGFGQLPPVKVGMSWTWQRDESQVMQSADRLLANAQERQKRAVMELAVHDATQAANPAPPPGPARENGNSDAQERRLQLQLEVDAANAALSFARKYQASTENDQQPKTPQGDRITPMRKKGSLDWENRVWRFRVAAGNVPIGDYFDLIRAAIK